ncbi:MAG: N-acetylmuramoyl-L-alanine amidase, partial [Bacteroidota bacterium]|nr:N-acetylmuramoyl-L-alanine amidase [Bacteroidota bacterium]
MIFGTSLFICAQTTTNNKIRTIVIDPGHGGKDPGTMGTKRYDKYEKDIALSVALMLGDYISNAFSEINVVYTRDKDEFLELNERTDIANRLKADLFISIHCDGFTNSKASGASVFVMGMSKLKANLDVAMRENAAIYLEDNYKQKYDGFDPKSIESYIVFNLMQNAYLEQSLQLAEEVEQEFATKANRKSRGVKQAPFYVISRTNMPSILVECGFLTNPSEEDFLQSLVGQDYIASAIFRAFKSYKEGIENVNDLLIEKKLLAKESDSMIVSINESHNKNGDDVVFKVQIGTYLKSMKSNNLFVQIKAKEEYVNGTFKYYVGAENKKNSADKIKRKMLDL